MGRYSYTCLELLWMTLVFVGSEPKPNVGISEKQTLDNEVTERRVVRPVPETTITDYLDGLIKEISYAHPRH